MSHIKQPRNIESLIIVTFGNTVKYIHFNIKCFKQFSYFTDLLPSPRTFHFRSKQI